MKTLFIIGASSGIGEALARYSASQSVGKPDCIWINGGVLLPETGKAWYDLANEKATFATNTLGAIAQQFFNGQGGHIAITASTASFLPFADYPAYAASKSAIRQYANSIRGQLRCENIDLTLLYLGFVRTQMTQSYEHKYPKFLFCDADQLIPPLFSALKRKKKSAVLPTMPWLPSTWFGKWFL